MDLGPHATFIWASYGAMAVIILALSLWLWLDGRRYKQALSALERRGIKRQSSSSQS